MLGVAATCSAITSALYEMTTPMTKHSQSIPRRRWLADAARPTAASLALGAVLSVVGSTPAEAGQVRTAFRDASPLLRDPKAVVKNGGKIKLEITLWDGKRGTPNQTIKFYVYYGNDNPVYVDKAKTNRHGVCAHHTHPLAGARKAGVRPGLEAVGPTSAPVGAWLA